MIAEIMKDIGVVFFASVFIGPMLSGNSNVLTVFTGIFLALYAWYMNIAITK
jgi:hypothetical protein